MVSFVRVAPFPGTNTKPIVGVNDAPSLKKADCGIAVEGSSEAAQAAADIVFLAPGLSTIILSIKTARQVRA